MRNPAMPIYIENTISNIAFDCEDKSNSKKNLLLKISRIFTNVSSPN